MSDPGYDLIIVGAGTAGCVLAERLTRSGRLKVLLIEAGAAPRNRFVSIPAGFTKLFKSKLDWAFESEPQLAVGGRRIFTPRGKMLGGSSNMNAQIHQWCHPADFNGWATMGAAGWSWSDVAGVFRAQEKWLEHDDQDSRGRDGPMLVSANRNARPVSRAFVEAARNAGLGGELQYNGRAFSGAWLCEIGHQDGRRYSVYDAYLKPAMRRPNLQVLTDAHATRVVIDGGCATGVAVSRAGLESKFAAANVVLAAGAFGTPQLLVHSGIGPADVLERLGITVRKEAPEVAQNLQDHPVLTLTFGTRDSDTLKSAESIANVMRYLLFKRGMLASNGIEAFAFAQARPGSVSAPDLELICAPLEYRNQFLEPPKVHAFSIGAAVVAPQSRGRLLFKSADPLAAPAIDFGLLSDPDGIDASVLCKGVRLAREIAASAPLSTLGTGELRPGVATQTDDQILDYASRELQTVYHPSSTCRMGSDARAVVDSQLRMRGVGGLWVADASVMPTVPRGHPNAVVAMIAQRAADWIEPRARGF